MRRLHLKLYLSVVGTLVVFLIGGALIWHFFAPRESMWGVQSASGVAAILFREEPPTGEQEDAMLEAISWQLHADVALYPAVGDRPLKTQGHEFAFTPEMAAHEGWLITRHGPVFTRNFADGRRLVVHPRQRFLLHGLHLGLMFSGLALALALITSQCETVCALIAITAPPKPEQFDTEQCSTIPPICESVMPVPIAELIVQ